MSSLSMSTEKTIKIQKIILQTPTVAIALLGGRIDKLISMATVSKRIEIIILQLSTPAKNIFEYNFYHLLTTKDICSGRHVSRNV